MCGSRFLQVLRQLEYRVGQDPELGAETRGLADRRRLDFGIP